MLVVPVYFDFASSLCHVAHRVMERMAGELVELDIALRWCPIDLVRLTSWRRGDPIEGLRRSNAERVATELRVPLRMPSVWMDSRRANAIALGLDGDSREPDWRELVFSSVYEAGRSLDEPGLIDELARKLGLDAKELATPRAIERVELESLLATESDVSGVPTFLLGEWPLSGIQEESTMRAILERWAQKSAELH